jgi:hypothetical protein
MPWKECHIMDERLRFVARLLDGEKMGRLVGSCSPATDNDGHATKRPSTFFEHRRRLIQPTRKPTDLTNPSTESDQVHALKESAESRLAPFCLPPRGVDTTRPPWKPPRHEAQWLGPVYRPDHHGDTAGLTD